MGSHLLRVGVTRFCYQLRLLLGLRRVLHVAYISREANAGVVPLIVPLARREFWEAAVIGSSLGRTVKIKATSKAQKSGKRMALSCFPPAQWQTWLVALVRPQQRFAENIPKTDVGQPGFSQQPTCVGSGLILDPGGFPLGTGFPW